MTSRTARFNPLHSLKTQLVVGAIVLLALSIGSISYSLVVQQTHMLTSEIEKTIIYQGRNIALSCQTSLLRSDPELELYPQVRRILSQSENISLVVITDSDGLIQGAEELTDLSRPFDPDLTEYQPREFTLLTAGEELHDSRESFWFSTPVRSLGKDIGRVHVRYSKIDLQRSTQRAITTTGIWGAIAFGLGIVLALVLFRRISSPLDVLVQGAKRIGSGDLDARIELRTRNEFSVLADSVNDMATRIAQTQVELIAKERLDRELEIAHDIQNTLVPSESFKTDDFEISFYYKAAEEVGGDYVDTFPIDGQSIALVMADASGKGVPGLVVMTMLKFMVRDLVNKGLTPVEVVRKLNPALAKNLKPKMFVTLFIAYLNLETGEVVCSNAGHNPLMLYKKNENRCDLFKMDGPPLGVFPNDVFTPMLDELRFTVGPGDLMFQYTDGLNESANLEGEQFGFDNVVKNGHRFASQGAMAFVQQMVLAEEEFRESARQGDDITLLALSCTEDVASETTPSQPKPGEHDGNIFVHSIDFDNQSVQVDVLGQFSRDAVSILDNLLATAERQGIKKIDVRHKGDLPTQTIAMLEAVESTHPGVTLSELRTNDLEVDGSCMYRFDPTSRGESSIKYMIRLSDFDSALDRINAAVRLVGSSIPLDGNCEAHLEFCIHELVANSIEHATFGDRDPAIEVILIPHSDTVSVAYRDNGEPFSPDDRLQVDISRRIKDGHKRGFGIYLIDQFTEDFKRERDDEWNSAVFRIKRDHELQEA